MASSCAEALREEPLVASEERRGLALRAVSWLKGPSRPGLDGVGRETIVILAFFRRPSPFLRPLCVCFGGGGRFAFTRVRLADPRAMSDGEYEIRQATWHVREMTIELPAGCDRLLIVCGGVWLKVGRSRLQDLRAEYARRISNASVDAGYAGWLSARRDELLSREVPSVGLRMSIVTPAYKTPPRFLRKMIGSVISQTYPNWELVLVNASPEDADMTAVLAEFDDERIKVVSVPENRGIVGNTNYGIGLCTGDYVSFFDHDDTVEPTALAELVRAINETDGRAGLLYCDEDNIDEEGRAFLPLIKPPLNPDLLLSNNYVIHWLTVRRDYLGKVELSGPSVEGAQDYDLTFKVIEAGAEVVRVPHVLYHWRIHAGSTAGDPMSKSYAQDAGTRAIEGHLERTGRLGSVSRGEAFFTYVTRFELPERLPSLLAVSVGGVSGVTANALAAYEARSGAKVLVLSPSSLPDLTRLDVRGFDCILFCTSEHCIDLDGLEALIADLARPDAFSVAPRVVRDDGLLDYAGMTVRPDGTLLSMLSMLPEDDGGYVGRAQRPYDACVLNPECCLVKCSDLKGLSLSGGFKTGEGQLCEAFLRAYELGLHNVFEPYVTSTLCGPRTTFEREPSDRQLNDGRRLLELFPRLSQGDPSHNPNFDPWNAYYRLSWKKTTSKRGNNPSEPA